MFSCLDGLVGLNDSVIVDQLPDGQPAQPVQQLLLRPAPAEITTHSPGCCTLLHLQGLQQVLLSSSPYCDEIHQLAHDHTIGYHKPGVEGSILRDLLEAIDSNGELLHDGVLVIPNVVVPLQRLVKMTSQ